MDTQSVRGTHGVQQKVGARQSPCACASVRTPPETAEELGWRDEQEEKHEN